MNSGTQQGKHAVCYYSNRCQWSERFMKLLAQTAFRDEVHFICVDPNAQGVRPKLPTFLKIVPTLVVRGEDRPRTGEEVVNWVSEQQMLRSKPRQGGGGGASGPAAASELEPEPWISGEMGGSYTKSFSFLNGENEAPLGDFAFLNGQQAVSTKTASDMPGGGLGARGQDKKSEKAQLFDKQMESFMRNRDSGMPKQVARM